MLSGYSRATHSLALGSPRPSTPGQRSHCGPTKPPCGVGAATGPPSPQQGPGTRLPWGCSVQPELLSWGPPGPGLRPQRDPGPKEGEPGKSRHLRTSDMAGPCGAMARAALGLEAPCTLMCRRCRQGEKLQTQMLVLSPDQGPSRTPTTCCCPLTPPGQPLSLLQRMKPVRFPLPKGSLPSPICSTSQHCP